MRRCGRLRGLQTRTSLPPCLRIGEVEAVAMRVLLALIWLLTLLNLAGAKTATGEIDATAHDHSILSSVVAAVSSCHLKASPGSATPWRPWR